jgi:phosphoglycerate dehydrogenase-like enzyme
MRILMTEAARSRLGERLRAVAPDAEVITVSTDRSYRCDGQLVAVEDIDAEIAWVSFDTDPDRLIGSMVGRIMKAPSMRWAQYFLAGLDAPVFRDMLARGVRITKNTAQSIPIAEYVVAHALSLLAPIKAQADAQREHVWKPTPYREIARTRWVLVGYGAIGREIARRIKPFGVDVTVVRRTPGAEEFADRSVTMADLPGVLPAADVIVLACALNDQTRNLADAAFFAALKPGAVLINIGRGALIDEDALRAGLDRDQPAHAVLDVFVTEPLPADAWFWDHPKVRVSAHTSYSGDGNSGREDALFLENLARYRAGLPLLNEAGPADVGL